VVKPRMISNIWVLKAFGTIRTTGLTCKIVPMGARFVSVGSHSSEDVDVRHVLVASIRLE
jgi:hypothetical protein